MEAPWEQKLVLNGNVISGSKDEFYFEGTPDELVSKINSENRQPLANGLYLKRREVTKPTGLRSCDVDCPHRPKSTVTTVQARTLKTTKSGKKYKAKPSQKNCCQHRTSFHEVRKNWWTIQNECFTHVGHPSYEGPAVTVLTREQAAELISLIAKDNLTKPATLLAIKNMLGMLSTEDLIIDDRQVELWRHKAKVNRASEKLRCMAVNMRSKGITHQ